MKEKFIVASIVAFSIIVLYLGAASMKYDEERQCDGSTRFYAHAGKVWACDNYKKPPQGQQQESSEWTNN